MFFTILLIVVGFFSVFLFFSLQLSKLKYIYNRNANDKRFCVCIETTICSSCCCCYYYIVVHARRTFDIHCNVCMYNIYIKQTHSIVFNIHLRLDISNNSNNKWKSRTDSVFTFCLYKLLLSRCRFAVRPRKWTNDFFLKLTVTMNIFTGESNSCRAYSTHSIIILSRIL